LTRLTVRHGLMGRAFEAKARVGMTYTAANTSALRMALPTAFVASAEQSSAERAHDLCRASDELILSAAHLMRSSRELLRAADLQMDHTQTQARNRQARLVAADKTPTS
jgi:hypothetical protein